MYDLIISLRLGRPSELVYMTKLLNHSLNLRRQISPSNYLTFIAQYWNLPIHDTITIPTFNYFPIFQAKIFGYSWNLPSKILSTFIYQLALDLS